jgi:hypothetical protein
MLCSLQENSNVWWEPEISVFSTQEHYPEHRGSTFHEKCQQRSIMLHGIISQEASYILAYHGFCV